MKKNKYIFIVTIILSVLLFTGCTTKEAKLICTQSQSDVDIEFVVGFKGNMVKSMDFSYDMDLSEYSELQIEAIGKQDFCTKIKSSMTDYTEAFSSCEQKIIDNHLRVESSLDVNKLANGVKDLMTTPEKGKEELEKSSYSCIIEE